MKNFTEITDLKECFEITGLPDAKTIAEIPAEFHEEMLADYRTKVMAKCANSLSKPGVPVDWSNHDQRKHFPVFEMLSSGSVDFDDTNYSSRTRTRVSPPAAPSSMKSTRDTRPPRGLKNSIRL